MGDEEWKERYHRLRETHSKLKIEFTKQTKELQHAKVQVSLGARERAPLSLRVSRAAMPPLR